MNSSEETSLESEKRRNADTALSEPTVASSSTNSNTPFAIRSYHYISDMLGNGLQTAIETFYDTTVPDYDKDLVSFDKLPKWAQDNNYIEKWHRLPKTNFAYCFRSMLYWHCETGNIWSHLIGALLCIGLTIYFVTAPSDKFIASFEEKHLITLFLISAIVCLLFSTLYHTLACHSERILRLFGRLDFSGIALLIMGSFVPWVYYSFYCTSQPRAVYLITISVLGIAAIVFSQWDRFAKPEYRVVRAAMFSALGASGIIPMLHVGIERGVGYAFNEGQLHYLILMLLSYGTGAALYATRVPERFYPGKLDLVLHSHQIFHILVVVGVMLHLFVITNLQFYRWQQGNKC
jgi:adiponectin receptor